MSATTPSRERWPLWSRIPVAVMLGAAVFLLPGDTSDAGPAMLRFALSAVVIGTVGFSWWAVPFAWLAPLLALGFRDATDCPDCGGGGEELSAGAQFLLAVIGLAAFSAAVAAAVGLAKGMRWLISTHWDWRMPAVPMALVFAAPLLLAMGGITTTLVRKEMRADENGDVLYDPGDRRVREGKEWDGKGTEQSMTEAEIRTYDDIPLFWLGTDFRGMNLVAAIETGNASPTLQFPIAGGVAFIYGKCGPAPCAVPLQVNVSAICAGPAYYLDPETEILPSGLAVRRWPEQPPSAAVGDSWVVYTGSLLLRFNWNVPGLTLDDLLAAVSSPNGATLGPPAAQPCPPS